MASERTHCSVTDVPIVLREVNAADRGTGSGKPAGFWYEVDGDWRRWCEAASFGSFKHIHSVDLADCNVLKIPTVFDLDLFHEKFVSDSGERWNRKIDWTRVSELYDGVEIAPYLWERRLSDEISWYYSWDCASGVIWRPRNARVTYLGEYHPEAELQLQTQSEEN